MSKSADKNAERGKFRRRFHNTIVPMMDLRFSMAGLLFLTFLSGYLFNVFLLWVGITWMAVRFPLALLFSYGSFMTWAWMWLESLDPAEGRLSAANSRSFDRCGPALFGAVMIRHHSEVRGRPVASNGNGSFGDIPVGDVVDTISDGASALVSSDENGLFLLIIGFLALCFSGVLIHLLWIAPEILSETLFEFALGRYLTDKCQEWRYQPSWSGRLLNATVIPFCFMLFLGWGIGYVASIHCPTAVTITQALKHRHSDNANPFRMSPSSYSTTGGYEAEKSPG
jgi:hypothetical protein